MAIHGKLCQVKLIEDKSDPELTKWLILTLYYWQETADYLIAIKELKVIVYNYVLYHVFFGALVLLSQERFLVLYTLYNWFVFNLISEYKTPN